MRNTILALLLLVAAAATAQVTSRNAQVPDEESLLERLANIEKKNDWLSLYMNMHGAFDAKFNQGGRNGLSQGAFEMKQLRIEAKGKVNSWLSYRWRQRLNRGNAGDGMIDNLPNSIDLAYIAVRIGSKLTLSAGKQCVAYGGFEFDANPIEIYQYSEIINNMSNFMTGVTLTYDMTPGQQLQFQILDSRNGSQAATYGPGLEESRLPLVYSINWNADMFGKAWQTRWSASVMEETQGNYMYYVALGNQFNFSKRCNMYVDLMSSLEDVDRKGIMTGILGKLDGHNRLGAMYNSLVAKINWRVRPRWNLFAKGMFESAGMFKEANGYGKGNYRTSIGYVAGVEYYPMDTNLHFFLTYVGQDCFFTERAKAAGQKDFGTQRVALGFIYQLPVF